MSGARPARPGVRRPVSSPAEPEATDGRQRPLVMLLSLVVAFTLWFTFSMRETYVVSVTVPIEVASVPSGQALASPPPASVVAQVQGEGWSLLALSRRVPSVRLAATTPQLDVASALRESGLPADLTVVGAQPRTVQLDLDTRTTRRVPVRLVTRLEMAPSYGLVRSPDLSPDSVVVSGAQSILGTLSSWPTEPLAAENVRGSLVQWVALRDTLAGLVDTDRRQTLARITVGEFTEGERSLRVVVRGRPAGAPEVRFEPAEVRAVYRVPADATYERAAAADAFVASVDYADILRDTTSGTVPVSPRVPSGLDVRDIVVAPTRVGYFLVRPRPVMPAEPSPAAP